MANEKLTITLTGRPPVKITKDEWPVIASAEDKEFDNQYEFQANTKAAWKLIVRHHQDGRTIVYAIHSYTTQSGGRDRNLRGGELLPTGEAGAIIEAIFRVAAEIEARMPEGQWSTGVFPRLAHECTADMPAVEI